MHFAAQKKTLTDVGNAIYQLLQISIQKTFFAPVIRRKPRREKHAWIKPATHFFTVNICWIIYFIKHFSYAGKTNSGFYYALYKKRKKRRKSNYEIALQKWRNEEKNSCCNYRFIGKS